MRLAQLAELCQAQLIRGDPERVVESISIDSRTLRCGDCFLALRGKHFDGHEFISEASHSGALAAIVSDHARAMNSPGALALLQVQDTLAALHRLAMNYRRLIPPSTRVIAISGTCGKTTTKEMIAAVLSERFDTVKTPANNNNHIGVPLAMLSLNHAIDYGVFELGSNHPGEMRLLAELVQPHIAVVTNIGLAHVEFFGDEAGVSQEEGTPLEYLPHNGDGLAVLNADDHWCSELRRRTRATVLTVGIENFADIRATDILMNSGPADGGAVVEFRLSIAKKREDVIVRLKTLGRHQIYNALQAAAVGYFAGMDLDEIQAGLENVELPKMRVQPLTISGVRFVNDCYNANVPSMGAALLMLKDCPSRGRKIAVLGDMLELGSWTQRAHQEIGALAARCGLTFLITVGPSARWIAEAAVGAGMKTHCVLSLADPCEASKTVGALAQPGDLVLLKGSRRMGLEKILDGFKK